jgi:hypothetical protein
MVPPWTYEPHLRAASDRLTLRWLDAGGHVGYPAGLSLGEQAAPGVESQVLAWLTRQ